VARFEIALTVGVGGEELDLLPDMTLSEVEGATITEDHTIFVLPGVGELTKAIGIG
jgi:hypothetical protein